MMKYRRSALFLVGFALVAFVAMPAMAEEISIVKEGHSVETVTAKELKRMLLGKSKRWKNGDKVVLSTLKDGESHDRFIRKYAGKTPKQFTNYWRKMVFSGKGTMPKSFESEDELIAFVAENDGAIGYIDSATTHDAVKELPID